MRGFFTRPFHSRRQALSERGHGSLARSGIAVRRREVLAICPLHAVEQRDLAAHRYKSSLLCPTK
jgi:hypothetical protein